MRVTHFLVFVDCEGFVQSADLVDNFEHTFDITEARKYKNEDTAEAVASRAGGRIVTVYE